jgi:hypothetical protein
MSHEEAKYYADRWNESAEIINNVWGVIDGQVRRATTRTRAVAALVNRRFVPVVYLRGYKQPTPIAALQLY